MFRICSASGLTTAANEDITNIIRQHTKLKDTDLHFFPFIMKKINLSCDQSTSVYFNTEDEFIALGLNKTFLKDPGNDEFIVATDMGDAVINRIVIAEINTGWIITFSY